VPVCRTLPGTSGGVGDSTPAAAQGGRASLMAELFKDVNTGSDER
jgi:hypothetical protein